MILSQYSCYIHPCNILVNNIRKCGYLPAGKGTTLQRHNPSEDLSNKTLNIDGSKKLNDLSQYLAAILLALQTILENVVTKLQVACKQTTKVPSYQELLLDLEIPLYIYRLHEQPMDIE